MKRRLSRAGALLLAFALAVTLAPPARAADASGDFTYGSGGEAVHLSADALADCVGRAFAYVTFTLPSNSAGTLYYNYIDSDVYEDAVSSGARYYASGSPSADKIWFAPAAGYAGIVSISFTAYDGVGNRLGSAAIRVIVSDSGSGAASGGSSADISYTVREGRSVSLSSSDFERLSTARTGYSLSYIRFSSLPSYGTLYDSSYSYSSNNYYVAVNRTYSYPGDIRYVGPSGYSGTVTVPFVGRAVNGETFDGTVGFTVSQTADSPLHYSVDAGKRVYFVAEDFSDACYAATGYEISYVRFNSLPSSYNGTLYSGGMSLVTVNSSYYRSSLNNLNFYAAGDFSSSISIPFTGYANGYASSNGRSFRGTITIDAGAARTAETTRPTGSGGSTLTYYSTGPAVTLRLSDLQNAAASALPDAPAVFSLTRPDAAEGRLCLDFITLSNNSAFDATRSYPISDAARVSFLPKAGFSGTARISYTLSDARGNSFRGNIDFVVVPPTRSSYFSDMGNTAWAVPAADFFRYYGAANGNSATGFGPTAEMRRGDFILLLSRAFAFPGAGTTSFADVPADKYYAAAIASAKSMGVLSGSAADNFRPEDGISRQDAALYLYRALRRIQTVTPGTAADLSAYRDAGDVSSYAVEAMGALVRLGVFSGDYGRLYPTATLNRAETMKILYYALT